LNWLPPRAFKIDDNITGNQRAEARSKSGAFVVPRPIV
jgi:hypothetical protein